MLGPRRSLFVAATLLTAAGAAAQEKVPSSYTNLATYSLSVPLGDTRGFLRTPSWIGLGWEGLWRIRANTAAGVAIGIHDFYDRSSGTTDFASGSATGDQLRDLLVMTLMVTGRWFLPGTAGRFYLAMGAGGLYAQQTYQLGLIPQLRRSAGHLAAAPEAGVAIRLFRGVDAVISARYTVPNSAGSYLGGGSRRFQFLTLNIGLAEH